MKEEKYIEDISSLILRSIKGCLSEAETTRLLDWRSENDNNERLFQNLISSYKTEDYESFEEAFSTMDWNIIKNRISKSPRQSSMLYRSMIASAAAVLVGVFSFFMINNLSKKHGTDEVAPQLTNIHPGSAKATLILASGETIEVDENTSIDELSSHGLYIYGHSVASGDYAELPAETHTWIVPIGGEFFVTLPDGSSVWLNSESKLVYPSLFNGNERKVQIEGEAYFAVAKNHQQPFIVEVGQARINVTGTEFNVSAYGSKIETTLVSGEVRMAAGENEVVLMPNMQGIWHEGAHTITVQEVDATIYAAWKDGLFEFRDLPLSEIVEKLGRWYDVDFRFDNEAAAEMRFTGAFAKGESIAYILDVIKDTQSVNYAFDGNTIILK